MDKYIGKLLDNRYEILQLIGTGGMAKVYKARCHRLNRLVAVKILKEEFAKDDEFRNRFHGESRAVAMLSHPNIMAVYDVSRSNSVEYIVMELLDGMTLKQYMDHKGTLTWKEALHFVTQILKALGHAHEKGIIHRDIKPHNIMLLRDGTIKVADFGIARFAATQGTLTKEALGSVHYISPEQARGGHIGARAHIYSTGVMLYEMITGRLPYEGDSPVSVAIQHINSMPLNPRDINPDIPEALENITMRAMCADLAKRYRSCDEMLEDLEEFRKNPNVVLDCGVLDISENASNDGEKTRKINAVSAGYSDGNTTKYKTGDDWDDEFDDDEEDGEGAFSKVPLIAGIVAGGIFLAGVIALLVTIFGGGGSEFTVPDLVGEVFQEVIENKEYDKFQIIEDGREFNSEYEEGEIISQIPEKGKTVKENAEIRVVISQGTKMVKVSDVTNMSQKQARIELENELGLEIKVEYETSDEIVEDYVIRTEPEAGEDIAVGEIVTVYLSKGKEVKNTKVPNLYGMTQAQAVRELENSELIVGEIEEVVNSRPKGTVVAQSIAKDSEVEEKTSIDIQISAGAQEEPPKENKPEQNKPAVNNSSQSGNDSKPASGETENPKPAENQQPQVQPPQASESNNEPPKDEGKSKTIPIKLPTSPESFTLTVKVNGNSVYAKTHKASEGTANVSISGEGTSTVSIYINDKLFNEISVDFS